MIHVLLQNYAKITFAKLGYREERFRFITFVQVKLCCNFYNCV